MFDAYGLLGAGSGIAIAIYLFSSIRRRTVRVSDPAASIRLPNRVDLEQLLSQVVVVEWGALAMFVLAELLPGELKTWLRLMAVSCGAAIAILYLHCVMRLRRLGVMNSQHPAEPPRGGARRGRLRGRIRARD